MKYEETARRLKILLEERAMSQQRLSELTGIGKASISQYVNGRNIPSAKNAEKIAKYLKVHPQWLMGFDTPEMILSEPQYSEDEIELIELYRSASDEEKRMIAEMLLFFKTKKAD